MDPASGSQARGFQSAYRFRDARGRDAALGMRDYRTELLAVRARMASLRALRLAKEAREATAKLVSRKGRS
jgi:hypothetical protein